MNSRLLRVAIILTALWAALPAFAQKDPYVGEVAMSPQKTLMENLSASPIHTLFVKALASTHVDQLFANGGPYTVFAPTDDAFRKFQRSTPGRPPEENEDLATLLKYHILQARLTAKKLGKLVKKGHGTATLQTLAGQPLTVKKYGSILVLTDAKGGTATVITPDVKCRNGYFHVIDAVLLPH